MGTHQAGDQLLVKTLGTEPVMSPPGWQHYRIVVITHCRKIKHGLCGSTGGGPLEACVLFPVDFTPCTFSFCFLCNKSEARV